jgi:hypothetical protein
MTSPEQITDGEQLIAELRGQGLAVEDLQVVPYDGRRSLAAIEWVGIFIGTGVAGTLLAKITEDCYTVAKNWARARRKEQLPTRTATRVRPIGIIIFDAEGNELAKWTTDEADNAGPTA